MMMEKKLEKKSDLKRIAIFLGITFFLTYGVEIFVIRPMVGSTDLNQAYLAQLLVAGVMFFPACGAFFTRLMTGEKLSKDNLMLAPHLKGNLKYYALAWFGTAFFIFLGAALYFLLYPTQFDGNMGYIKVLYESRGVTVNSSELKSIIISQVLMGVFLSPLLNFINCFGEEWGWRGYLLPKMLGQLKVVPALLITGVIWGLWHAPLTVMGHNYGLGYRGYPVAGILAMCLFCIVIGIFLSYVTIRTQSCIPAVIGHAVLNGLSAIGLCFTSLQNPYNVFLGPAPTGVIGGLGFILMAAVLLILLYKEEKQKK